MSKRQNKNKNNKNSLNTNTPTSGIRIDKWLWAARFFKTRSIAKNAIEGGKVHLNGERVKVSREVQIGMLLTIQQGIEKKTVLVKGLSDVRGSAPIAQQLYEETAESIERRIQQAEQRKLNSMMFMSHRPNKKDRRDIDKFHQQYDFADDFSDDMFEREYDEWVDDNFEDWEDDEE
ncbi:RNA-binding S4 domain-containing protein [Moraxella sp. ZY210820]|uniref:RNA-binding S4 domain-containing protein n=1 Tax=unclassified Moraxella TaxID=2685852 RepID=UPI00273021B8|nr:S4 domain-containing protein [Moraxella sp. ZY210820]WLF83089.1 RNA-binding protein [Moraxella sp. ZY210820]